jgi:predicted porin
VTVFGTFDPSFANQKTSYANNPSVTQNLIRNNSQGTSQISFKGVEDLGGGLKASFMLENDFDAGKDATGNFSSKGGEQYLALEGGFGKIAAGAPNTPSLTAQASRQPFSTKIGGGFSASGVSSAIAPVVAYTAGAQGVTGTGHVRSNNSLVYSTPDFSGFSAAVAYVNPNKADANAATAVKELGSVVDIGVNYANGPFRAGLSNWSQAANGTGGGATAVGKNKQTNLYAQYDVAGATLYAGFHAEKTDNAAATAKVVDSTGWNVAAKYALTPSINLLANYGALNDKLVANQDKKITAIGAQYLLSARTNVYVRYVDEKNINATVGQTGAASAITGVKTALVGVQHNF